VPRPTRWGPAVLSSPAQVHLYNPCKLLPGSRTNMTLPGWIVRRTLARLKEKRKLQQELNVLLRDSLNMAQSRSLLRLN
jgi:hypothetical protein